VVCNDAWANALFWRHYEAWPLTVTKYSKNNHFIFPVIFKYFLNWVFPKIASETTEDDSQNKGVESPGTSFQEDTNADGNAVCLLLQGAFQDRAISLDLLFSWMVGEVSLCKCEDCLVRGYFYQIINFFHKLINF